MSPCCKNSTINHVAECIQLRWVMPKTTAQLLQCRSKRIRGTTAGWKRTSMHLVGCVQGIKMFARQTNSIQHIKLDCELCIFWCKEEFVNEIDTILSFYGPNKTRKGWFFFLVLSLYISQYFLSPAAFKKIII